MFIGEQAFSASFWDPTQMHGFTRSEWNVGASVLHRKKPVVKFVIILIET